MVKRNQMYVPEWLVTDEQLWDAVTDTSERQRGPDYVQFYGESSLHKALNNLEFVAIGQIILQHPDLHKVYEERMKEARVARSLFWRGFSKGEVERWRLTPEDIAAAAVDQIDKLVRCHVVPSSREEALVLSHDIAKVEREAMARGQELIQLHGQEAVLRMMKS